MTITLPSTSIKAKYLRTIPVSSVYRDPNGYNYQVVEKKMNNSLIKSAQHYLGQEIEPIILQDIPEDMLKKDNPNKANITKLMKSRINELEESVKQLLQQQHKSLYQRIQDLLDEKEMSNVQFQIEEIRELEIDPRSGKFRLVVREDEIA
jgi:hypothetical protein